MQYLIRREAAQHVKDCGLPCTANTLQKLATVGGGPVYQIFGNKAVYLESNLDLWIQEKLSPPRKSTSEVVDNGNECRALAEDDKAAEEEGRRRDEGEEEDAEEEIEA